jgi:hydrogenase maturation protease
MEELGRRLRVVLQSRARFVGLGNAELGDDAAGLALAARLRLAGRPDVLDAGTCPERHLTRLAERGADAVIFLDAVDVGAAAGSVVFLDAAETAARVPQVSTHKLSLALLAQLIQALGGPPVYLLGIQPASLRPSSALSPPVAATVALLAELLVESERAADAVGTRGGERP